MASTNNCSLILSQFSDFKIIKYSNVTLKKKTAFQKVPLSKILRVSTIHNPKTTNLLYMNSSMNGMCLRPKFFFQLQQESKQWRIRKPTWSVVNSGFPEETNKSPSNSHEHKAAPIEKLLSQPSTTPTNISAKAVQNWNLFSKKSWNPQKGTRDSEEKR